MNNDYENNERWAEMKMDDTQWNSKVSSRASRDFFSAVLLWLLIQWHIHVDPASIFIRVDQTMSEWNVKHLIGNVPVK